jgi:hypothetical protein
VAKSLELPEIPCFIEQNVHSLQLSIFRVHLPYYFLFRNNISETALCLHPQVENFTVGTYLRTPEPTQDRIHKPNTT